MLTNKRWHRRYGLLTIALAAGLAGAAQAELPFNFATAPGKLPKDVVPSAYRIDLSPDLDKLTFSGHEEVDVTLAKPTDSITLDAIGLEFASVTARSDGSVATVSIDAKTETATLHFPHKLAKGPQTLVISYSGAIPETPAGLYYNDYKTELGEKKRMLVSQFEATDARRAFPGWDEPAFKATFKLSVTLPKSLAAVSNTPITAETDAGADSRGAPLKKIDFAPTPRMSTYLLVLCAGELDHIHDDSTGTDIGVWTVQGKAEQGRGAIEAAKRILPYYNDYFGVSYPLPKLDLIAVPGNYTAGAMENWGGITFIDNLLLFDPKISSEATRQDIYRVLAHEMAHQWSGDLVTMGWWDNTWLNEGFASWMEAKATDKLNPDWQFWLRQHDSKERAFEDDAHSTTHPIQISIKDETEITGAFDFISYQKGQAFLRMLESYLGEDAFRAGMRRYMKKFAYSNTTTADLWTELGAASGKPVAKIAAGFTEQPGIPLITVSSRCDGGKTVATLTQGRFTIGDPKAAPLSWKVPVQLSVIGPDQDKRVQTVLVENGKAMATFAGCGAPVKANFGDVGYFRTAYDKDGLNALIKAYPAMSAADRVNFLTDAWALVQAGHLESGIYLDLTRQLSDETAPVVWSNLVRELVSIDDAELGAAGRDAFRAYAAAVLRPALARFGWDAKPGEDIQVRGIRGPVIDALGRFGDAEVIAECRHRFDAFLADPSALAPDLRAAVLNTVARGADQATFDKLRDLGRAATGSEEKLRYYMALARVRDPALSDQAADIALTSEISNGRVSLFLRTLAGQSDDPLRVWKKAMAIRTPVLAKLSSGPGSPLMIPMLAEPTADPAVAKEMLALPETNVNVGVKIQARKAAEMIDWLAGFKATLAPAVSVWLGQSRS